MKAKKKNQRLDYNQQKKLLTNFMKSFQDPEFADQNECYAMFGNKKYLILIQKIANLELKVIQIVLDDLDQFLRKDIESQIQIANGLRKNTFRYIKIFEEIISEMIPKPNKHFNPEQEIQNEYNSILRKQRQINLHTTNLAIKAQNQYIPFRLNQDFDVSIVFGPNSKVNVKTISQIRAQNIGELIMTKAIVVRKSQIKPQLMVATYICDICNGENYREINDSTFKPLTQCDSTKCKEAKMSGKLTFLPSHSRFRSLQQIKIQETPQQLLRGAIPKYTNLELRGNLVNQVQPGDIVKIQGVVLPKFRSKNPFYKDLFFDSYIHVTKIIKQKKKYVDMEISEEMRQKVIEEKQKLEDEEFYTNVARSIAPQIYGMETVKKALLLQMAGGVTTENDDNLKIRGQINVALFGDPGIAKSQLLKHISHISPRAVYTTGKGSSGVGLTAAIVTDPTTNQLSLEAGALVLADMGICCIDQFDKMEETDRTAIHEVMEQQTVSITKAGIITTLNARTAVLAAANPLYGRYNKSETTQKNLNLPAALLSRFDLIFVLLDTPNKERDIQLAKHIGQVHQKKKAPVNCIFNQNFLKTYIAMCKQYNPVIPEQLHEQMITRYVKNRQLQMDVTKQGQSYTTLRSLLALIRLSQARAKLRFSNEVLATDIMQSLQIINESQRSVQIKPKEISKLKPDPISAIYQMIKQYCNYNTQKIIEIQSLRNRVISRGFSNDKFQQTISIYTKLGTLSNKQNLIRLIY